MIPVSSMPGVRAKGRLRNRQEDGVNEAIRTGGHDQCRAHKTVCG